MTTRTNPPPSPSESPILDLMLGDPRLGLELDGPDQVKRLLDTLPQIIWTTATTGAATYFNRRWWEYTGLRPDTYLPDQAIETIHPEDRAQVVEVWQKAFRDEQPFEHAYRLRSKSGDYRWHLGRLVPLFRGSRIELWLGTANDIHDHRSSAELAEKNAERLRLITDSMPVLISYVDADLHFRFVNRGYEKWFGKPREEIVDRPIIEIFGKAQYDNVIARIRRALAGEEQHYETLAPYPQGERAVEISHIPDRGPDGKVRGFFALVNDISDRRRNEQARLEAESRFRAFFEQSSLPMEIYALDGTPVEVNRAWEILFDTTKDQLADYNILTDPQTEATGLLPLLQRAIAGEAVGVPVFHYDPARIGKVGRARWLEASFFPVKDRGDQVRELAMILRDVTDREIAEMQLKTTNEELESAVRARQDLLNICGHELKTPLSSLKLQTQTAKRRIAKGDASVYEPAKVQKLLDSYENQIERLVHLVDDMLDFTRISSGKLALNPEPVQLSRLALEVLDRLSDQLAAAGCTISTSLQPNVCGIWDRFRIEQVLVNLLTNAMRYGHGTPITLSVTRTGDRAVLAVKDEGIGIAPEHHERIFHRFERAISATEKSGLGLGLYIVQEIVQAHEGNVKVESELGKGARFSVELPLTEPPHHG